MKDQWLTHYERYSSLAAFKLFINAVFARSKTLRLALLNQYRDYLRLADDPELLALHRQLNEQLLKANQNWESYDYGEGYYYQSFDSIGITGFRDTRGRVEAMRLRERLRGKSVLEIGCNTGFLSLSIADVAKCVFAFDVNSYLINIARLAANYLGLTRVDFEVLAFEDLASKDRFEAVLSFANHSTYDGNTRQSVEEYFDRCHECTSPGGMLLFESHAPQHEGEGLANIVSIIEQRFETESCEILDYGSLWDCGRTFIVAKRR